MKYRVVLHFYSFKAFWIYSWFIADLQLIYSWFTADSTHNKIRLLDLQLTQHIAKSDFQYRNRVFARSSYILILTTHVSNYEFCFKYQDFTLRIKTERIYQQYCLIFLDRKKIAKCNETKLIEHLNLK